MLAIPAAQYDASFPVSATRSQDQGGHGPGAACVRSDGRADQGGSSPVHGRGLLILRMYNEKTLLGCLI